MTVTELISVYDAQRPNKISAELKTRWIKELERILYVETIMTHEGDPRFTPLKTEDEYFDTWDDTSEVIARPPFDSVYTYWMDMQNASNQNDTKRYNFAATMYNNALLSYQQYYNRTYQPKTTETKILKHRWWT